VVACDITDPAQCKSAVSAAKAVFERIDILVNIAGGSGPIGKTGAQTTPEEFDDIVTLNMNGCFHTMHEVLPTMIEQQYGQNRQCWRHVRHARPGRPHGLFRLQMGPARITKSFALEVGQHNINVNYLAPAWSMDRASATRSAPTWPSASTFRLRKP